MAYARQIWSQVLACQDASGSIFDTYTTSKTVINQNSLVILGANTLQVGDGLNIKAMGAMTTLVTTPGTVTFEIKCGPTANIVVWSSGAIQLNATAHTLLPWRLDVDLTLQVENTTVGGAVAKFMGQGVLTGVMFTKTAGQTDGANSETVINVPVTTPAQGTAFDSTVTNILDFWVGFSISSASNRIRVDQYKVRAD